jgi:hypothetical protein
MARAGPKSAADVIFAMPTIARGGCDAAAFVTSRAHDEAWRRQNSDLRACLSADRPNRGNASAGLADRGRRSSRARNIGDDQSRVNSASSRLFPREQRAARLSDIVNSFAELSALFHRRRIAMAIKQGTFFKLLYIFDASDTLSTIQAGQHDGDPDVFSAGVIDPEDMFNTLKRMVEGGITFGNIVIETHGRPGAISFEKQDVIGGQFTDKSAGVGCEHLIPMYGKLYFSGCDCADGVAGWDFLERVGRVFLKTGGGEAIGWTSAGFAQISRTLPFFGHTIHFTGVVRTVTFAPGGFVTSSVESNPAVPNPEHGDYAPVDA